ncbi:MAG: 5-aminolevulinate synthase [Paracoccaceae bacterium]
MSFVLLARPGMLILAAALGYAVATYLMKMAANSGNYAFLGMIAFALLISVVAEILVLQRMHLGAAYIGIIATETLLVLGLAWIVGEGLSGKEYLGAVLVIAGSLLVSA